MPRPIEQRLARQHHLRARRGQRHARALPVEPRLARQRPQHGKAPFRVGLQLEQFGQRAPFPARRDIGGLRAGAQRHQTKLLVAFPRPSPRRGKPLLDRGPARPIGGMRPPAADFDIGARVIGRDADERVNVALFVGDVQRAVDDVPKPLRQRGEARELRQRQRPAEVAARALLQMEQRRVGAGQHPDAVETAANDALPRHATRSLSSSGTARAGSIASDTSSGASSAGPRRSGARSDGSAALSAVTSASAMAS